MTALHRETLGDQLYKLIRRRIVTGVLEPGQHVPQAEIALEMHVSRIPVRDALKRLEVDGLLVAEDNGRYKVASFTLDDARDTYTIRGRLEPLALELGFNSLRDASVPALEALLEQMSGAVESEDPDTYTELDTVFHYTIYNQSQNPRLIRLIEMVWSGTPPLMAIRVPERMRRSLLEHRSIVHELKNGTCESASAALGHHIESAFTDFAKDCAARAALRGEK